MTRDSKKSWRSRSSRNLFFRKECDLNVKGGPQTAIFAAALFVIIVLLYQSVESNEALRVILSVSQLDRDQPS